MFRGSCTSLHIDTLSSSLAAASETGEFAVLHLSDVPDIRRVGTLTRHYLPRKLTRADTECAAIHDIKLLGSDSLVATAGYVSFFSSNTRVRVLLARIQVVS